MNDISIFTSTELSANSFKELLPEFFEELYEDFEILELSVDKEDFSEIKRLAHKIKGSAASFAAQLISEKARMLQQSVNNKEIATTRVLFSELKECIALSYEYAKEKFEIKV